MRIIAGQWKGRRLQGPRSPLVRPTSDRLRETLFNVMTTRIDGARVLDAYAGTGAMGLEALSRGARHVTFVERDRQVICGLEDNIQACGATEACAIIRDDFLAMAPRQPPVGPFDVVMADPPYDESDLDAVVEMAAGWLAPDGRLVLEHSRRRTTREQVTGARRYRVLTAGDSALSFYAPDR
jgi:16S rRNA (guanine966-N2)-methyltransferase